MRDLSLELEAPGPGLGLLRPPPAASPVAEERVQPGRPGVGFVLGATGLALAVALTAFGLGVRGDVTPAESTVLADGSYAGLGLMLGRTVAAAFSGLAVAGVAVAGRRLTHSGPTGILAAALVALDPAFLVQGRLALPLAFEAAMLVWALAWVGSPGPLLHWVAGLALAAACFVQPAAVLWVLPLALLLLLRGHIYAAPRHLGLALIQVGLVPIVVVVARVALGAPVGGSPACWFLQPWQALGLTRVVEPGPGLLALHDPVAWLGGAGALLFLGLGGLALGLGRFRVARAPGRVQLRLTSPFPPTLGRGVWLLLLALAAPSAAWLPLFAIALALGVRELGDDAPGFGVALACVLLVFAGLVLWRAWGAIAGSPGGEAEALQMVPWASLTTC